MKNIYIPVILIWLLLSFSMFPETTFSQTCNTVTATYGITESRCAATGTIQINATGGSGNYQYKATGPVNTNYTSSSLITGLSAGRYLITIKDVVTNCIYNNDSVTVPGNYLAPGFTMSSTDVTCINGHDGTITVTGQSLGRPPFYYTIVAPSASGVGTVSIPGTFSGLIPGNYLIQLRDSCGAIQTRGAVIQNYDWFINNYAVTKIGCDSIAVTINLKDSKNNVTPHPVFNGFSYGASLRAGDTTWFLTNAFRYLKGNKHVVKLLAKDICGNIKSVVWTDNAIPKVDANIAINNKACSTFTATVTGQINLTAPVYCIYNNSNVLLACNSSGIFTQLAYGSYCIKITDICYDTSITRCFTVARPIPAATVKINTNCDNFTATVTAQENLNNPNYCLYDKNDILLYCNTTGIFTGLPFGRYCIKIVNDPACYDTTIILCFTVNRPVPVVGPDVTIINLTCTTFTVILGDTGHLNNPKFCLYTATHVLIICNSTGVFDNLPYGTYCIDVINNPVCYDTVITRCFTVSRPVPAVAATVAISNKSCTSFTATIRGQVNLNRPLYCIYDSLNIQLSCNSTGVFANLPYGYYCVRLQNDQTCYDTIITRCFRVSAPVADINLSAKKSCLTIGTTDLKVIINSGIPAFTISLFSPTGFLMQTVSTSSTNYTFSGIAALPAPQRYKVVVTDQCGSKDSVEIAPIISIVNRVITVSAKCPSGIWPFGSADVLINITNNNIGGSITPRIIKKNAVVVSINPSSSIRYNYTFLDLGPATYIFDTYIDDCNKHVYDTVIVRSYIFPDLSGSNAYQCDNNSFTVQGNVSGGITPYLFEIIGSVPATPSIITAPQASPLFNINNGTAYSLIRLRAVDACGNAGLYDVSVLPLANFIVIADSLECFNQSLTLRVDSIPNAVYTWYKRLVPNDSIIVGTGPTLYFPVLLPSDTGRYFCKVVVNNGCLIKFANYIITGFCGGILPISNKLCGTKKTEGNWLYWSNHNADTKDFVLERSQYNNTSFKAIMNIVNHGATAFSRMDKGACNGNNFYRLKILYLDNTFGYSNVVMIKNTKLEISIYPNPVNTDLFISISNDEHRNYAIEIDNKLGQMIYSRVYHNIQNGLIKFARLPDMLPGMYFLTITDLLTGEKQVHRLLYH